MASLPTTLQLQGYTGLDRPSFLPALLHALDRAGVWLLQQSCLSATSTRMEMELQAHALPEFYGTLVGKGLELTRGTHIALADCCNHSWQLGHAGQSRIIAIRLSIQFQRASRYRVAPEAVVMLKPACA